MTSLRLGKHKDGEEDEVERDGSDEIHEEPGFEVVLGYFLSVGDQRCARCCSIRNVEGEKQIDDEDAIDDVIGDRPRGGEGAVLRNERSDEGNRHTLHAHDEDD